MKRHPEGICVWHPLKEGWKCTFSAKTECGLGRCKSIVNECLGCKSIVGEPHKSDYQSLCKIYWNPEAQWRVGSCAKASHVDYIIDESGARLDPIKASKLMMGKKTLGKKEKRKKAANK